MTECETAVYTPVPSVSLVWQMCHAHWFLC